MKSFVALVVELSVGQGNRGLVSCSRVVAR